MNRLCWLLAGALLAAALTGCARVTPPNWLCPGTAPMQQSRARQFDPYPENEPSPPIAGGRPRAFEKPMPEVPRTQWRTQPARW